LKYEYFHLFLTFLIIAIIPIDIAKHIGNKGVAGAHQNAKLVVAIPINQPL
jgi:hypothetical protein